MSVRRARIGDILDLQRRAVALAPAASYQEIGVRSFGKGLFLKEPLSGADLGNKRVFTIATGDLIVSNVFAWEGAVGVAGTEHNGRIGSHRFMTWTPLGDSVEVGYVRHYFGSDAGLEQLQQASPGSAGRNRTLSVKNFEAIEVPLPDLVEQRRIASHLDRIDLVAEEAGGAAARRRHGLTVVAQRSWGGARTRIGDLVEPVSRPRRTEGGTSYRMQGVRWYGGGLFTREMKLGRELSATLVYDVLPGDLVYNRLFAWKQSFAVAGAEVVGSASNEFPTFRIDNERVRPRVLLALLLGRDFTQQVNDVSSGSTPTSRNRLKERDFLELEVELPDIREQRAIERILDKVDRVRPLTERAAVLSQAVLPAARNEIFSAMR